MKKLTRKLAKVSVAGIIAAALALMLGLYTPSGVRADEADARNLVKAMSDYMASQKAISFAYDSTLEVVTKVAGQEPASSIPNAKNQESNKERRMQ